jgi:hypothetical protein
VLKAAVQDLGGRQVRGREQTTVRLELVQPRRADHRQRSSLGARDVREERGQLGPPVLAAIEGERGVIVRLGVVEVQPEAVVPKERVREAAEGRDESRYSCQPGCVGSNARPSPKRM